MSEKPILMTAENYLQCADGTKTQTRRILKPQPEWVGIDPGGVNIGWLWNGCCFCEPGEGIKATAPLVTTHIRRGDLLYVKESLSKTIDGMIVYGNTEELYLEFSPLAASDLPVRWKWKRDYLPSMFMPKKFARLWLEVTAVRVERLRDISTSDVWAEGISQDEYETWVEDCSNIGGGGHCELPQAWFERLWNSINGKKHPWESNPWVWVYTFNRIERQDNDNPSL